MKLRSLLRPEASYCSGYFAVPKYFISYRHNRKLVIGFEATYYVCTVLYCSVIVLYIYFNTAFYINFLMESRFGSSGDVTEVGIGDCVVAANTAKVEIRREPNPVSPQVNGA